MSKYATYQEDSEPHKLLAKAPALTTKERKRLRDEIAIAALTGLVSRKPEPGSSSEQQENARFAARAYRIAEEMLATR